MVSAGREGAPSSPHGSHTTAGWPWAFLPTCHSAVRAPAWGPYPAGPAPQFLGVAGWRAREQLGSPRVFPETLLGDLRVEAEGEFCPVL